MILKTSSIKITIKPKSQFVLPKNRQQRRKQGKKAFWTKWQIYFFIFGFEKFYLLKNILCRSRWASKTPAVPDFYKRCTPWLKLETCCADLKSFTITLRPFGTKWQILNALKLYIFFILSVLFFHIKFLK